MWLKLFKYFNICHCFPNLYKISAFINIIQQQANTINAATQWYLNSVIKFNTGITIKNQRLAISTHLWTSASQQLITCLNKINYVSDPFKLNRVFFNYTTSHPTMHCCSNQLWYTMYTYNTIFLLSKYIIYDTLI